MRYFYSFIITLFFASSLNSQNWVWAKSAGGINANQYDDAYSIAVDPAGNSYVTGSFEGTATFGSFTVTSVGDVDVFVAKYDPAGTCLWVKRGGCIYADEAKGIAVDGQGNIYITGFYNAAPITFGSFTLASALWDDIFIVKYDNNGVEQWAVKAGGGGNDYGYGLTCDNSGNLFFVGNFEGSGSFGTNSVSSAGWGDVVVAKYSAGNGVCSWAVKGGGAGNEGGKGIAISGNNIYVTGYFRNSATFGTLPPISSSGYEDAFVAMLDMNGAWQWVKKGGSVNGNDQGTAVVADALGNVYATGYYDNVATFGSTTLTGGGQLDIYLLKYDAFGTLTYAKSYGGWGVDVGYGVKLDILGKLILAGSFEGQASWNSFQLTTFGFSDIFVARIDPVTGVTAWVAQAGAEDEDKALSVGLDSVSDVYIAGYYRDQCDFGSTNLNASVVDEIFVAKLDNVLGVNNLYSSGIKINIYPVPCSDVLNVMFADEFASGDDYSVAICDISGKLISRQELIEGTNMIQVGSLASGMYFLQVFRGSDVVARHKILRD
jgi:hypothetical protein